MKVSKPYSSIIRGVSQQAPADRLEGQHGEAVNVVFDPVRGITRRNGFVLESSRVTKFFAEPEPALQDSFSFRAFSYRDQERDYDILYRSRARVGDDSDAHLPFLVARDKTAKEFIPVVTDPGDGALSAWVANGVSAVIAVGSYVLLAARDYVPTFSADNQMAGKPWANTASIWVRGGNYNRTFTVKARKASTGQEYSISYTTPTASYPVPLDLSIVPTQAVGTPYEAYFQNILQRNYDRAVTEWAVMAANAIIPNNIAQELANRLTAAGMPGWAVRGSHLLHDDVAWVEVSDGGTNDWIRAVLNDVSLPTDVTEVHRVGKVVKVTPTGSDQEVYYLKAQAKAPGSSDPYQTVIWREAAGVVQTPTSVVAMARVVGNVLYVASGPAQLKALILAQTGQNLDVPVYEPSTAGDLDTVPAPAIFDKPITYMGTFQDRLLLAAGSVIVASGTGDYFNFYRTTVLTVPADDPTSFTAAGTESDTIRSGILYDRNLLLTGDSYVYALSGRQPLSAASPSMAVQFSIQGTGYANPAGIHKYVYFLQEDQMVGATRLLQVQSGLYQDSPSLGDASKQLRDYINGLPAEVLAIASPSTVIVRTEFYPRPPGGFPVSRPYGLYVYQYLDSPQEERLFDAWHAWEWGAALGTPLGISDAGTGDAFILYTLSYGADQDGERAYSINALRCSIRPDPSGLPYLDGLRPAADAEATGMLTPQALPAVRNTVYTAPGANNSYVDSSFADGMRWAEKDHPQYTVGDAPPEGLDGHRWTGIQGWLGDYTLQYPTAPTDDLWTGVHFSSYVDLTNPFVRDENGKALTGGRLNLIKYEVTTTRSVALQGTWTDYDGTEVTNGFDGEYARVRYNSVVWVGRDVRHVQVRLKSVGWKPFTINAISWAGNWFGDNPRR